MADANTDRNLLFGILALQMDFITHDALINGDERLRRRERQARWSGPPVARRSVRGR